MTNSTPILNFTRDELKTLTAKLNAALTEDFVEHSVWTPGTQDALVPYYLRWAVRMTSVDIIQAAYENAAARAEQDGLNDLAESVRSALYRRRNSSDYASYENAAAIQAELDVWLQGATTVGEALKLPATTPLTKVAHDVLTAAVRSAGQLAADQVAARLDVK